MMEGSPDQEPEVAVFEDRMPNLQRVFTDPEVEVERELDINPFKDESAESSDIEQCRGFLLDVDPDLVVLDADLTEFERSTVRKSDVREACRELGYPLCIYHRQSEGEYADPENIRDSDNRVIKIQPSEGHEKVRQECETLAAGFGALYEEATQLIHKNGNEQQLQGPSAIVSELVDVPVASRPKLDQYSWGEAGGIEVFSDADSRNEVARQTATILGYWIINSVLKFPGVLVDETALASYLGVGVSEFRNHSEAKTVFNEAQYEGPFADRGPYWWLSEVDNILTLGTTTDDDGIVDGQTFLEREKDIQLPPVKCVEGHEGAGYYDILDESPVCDEHSKSPDAWIPAGASLSRVSESESRVLEGW